MSALVIATASGAPMRSERPKPIHLLCGRPMLSYTLDTLESVGVDRVNIVTGPMVDWVSKRVLEDPPALTMNFVEQRIDRGPADAALIGLSGFDDFDDDGDVIVMPADLPLLEAGTLQRMVDHHRASGAVCTVLSAHVDDPGDHPRITRDRHGRVDAVIRSIELVGAEVDGDEIGLGVYIVRRGLLAPAIRRTRPDTVDGLYRLVDLVGVLAESGHPVDAAPVVDVLTDLRPVDDRRLLAEAEAELRRRTNLRWLDHGVSMIDPERTYIDATVSLGVDVTLFPGTILQGTTVIGDGCEIGPDTRLDRCSVGRDSVVEKTMARLSSIGDNCNVGPFAVLEPGSELVDGTSTGPFYAARAGD